MSLRGNLAYGTYRLLGALTGPLPPSIGYGMARRVGRLLYRFDHRLRRALTHNIRHVVGPDVAEEEVQALVCQACVNIAKGHYDLFRVNRLAEDEIMALTRIEGLEYVEQALAEGRGVILVSAHLGNVDLVGQLPMVYGVPLTAVAWRTEPERLFRYALSLRQSRGLRLLPSDGPMMDLFRALRRGELILLGLDRAVSDNVRPVDFFGSPAPLPDGPVRVALRTGAPLIPGFALRHPDDTFLIRLEPPVELPNTGDREADVAAGMKMVVAIMERYIAEHPEQWMVSVPVWPMDSP